MGAIKIIRNQIKNHEDNPHHSMMLVTADFINDLYNEDSVKVSVVNRFVGEEEDITLRQDNAVFEVTEGQETAFFQVTRVIDVVQKHVNPIRIIVKEVIPKETTVTVYEGIRLGQEKIAN